MKVKSKSSNYRAEMIDIKSFLGEESHFAAEGLQNSIARPSKLNFCALETEFQNEINLQCILIQKQFPGTSITCIFLWSDVQVEYLAWLEVQILQDFV